MKVYSEEPCDERSRNINGSNLPFLMFEKLCQRGVTAVSKYSKGGRVLVQSAIGGNSGVQYF